MPPKRRPYRRRPLRRRRRAPHKGRYRNRIARIIRQPTLKPKAAVQKLVYYNTFFADNILDTSGAQQCLIFQMNLNSVFPFSNIWDSNISNNVLNPNSSITPEGGTGGGTTLPGFADGYNP